MKKRFFSLTLVLVMLLSFLPTAVSAADYSKGATTLKNYIINKGTINDNGSATIKYETISNGYTYTSTITYFSDKNIMTFSTNIKKSSSQSVYIGFDYDISTQTAKNNSLSVGYLSSSSFTLTQASAVFNIRTYTSAANLTYTESSSMNPPSNIDEIYKASTEVAISAWNLMCYEKAGVTLNDIGFAAYGSSSSTAAPTAKPTATPTAKPTATPTAKPTATPTAKPTYTLTYNANGGTNAPSSQTAKSGDTVTLSSQTPTRKGYDFLGWSKSENAQTAAYTAGEHMILTANTTLYAVWSKIPMPDTTGNKITISDSELNGDTVSFTAELSTANEMQGTLIVTVYAADGELTDIMSYAAEKKKNISFTKQDGDSIINVFWWYDTSSMYPMADNEKIEIDNMPTISYKFDNGTLTIDSKGTMIDFESAANSPFYNRSDITKIIVNDGVTSIGSYAFEKCSNLTSITIPESVTDIGYGAFSGCSSLTDVYYTGSKEKWDDINISSYNTAFANAAIHFIYSITTEYDSANGTVAIIDNGSEINAAADGNAITISVTPNNGYAIRSIEVTDENENKINVTDGTFTMPKSKVNIKVTFDTAYTITKEYDEAYGTVTTTAAEFETDTTASGNVVTVNVTPIGGYAVRSIDVTAADGSKIDVTDNTFIMPDSNVTLTVVFDKEHTITNIYDSPRGTVTTTVSGNETIRAATGALVTINPTPESGYAVRLIEVTDESGNIIDVDSCTFTMPDSNVTVKVIFDQGCIINKEYDSTKGSVTMLSEGIEVTEAAVGAEVTINVICENSYAVRKLEVTDTIGRTIEVTDGKFTMPNSSVTVSVEFDTEYNIATEYNDTQGSVSTVSESISGVPVTLDISANDNYYVGSVEVKDGNGNEIDLDNNTFIMPNSNVTIKVVFIEITESGTCGNDLSYKLKNGTLTISGTGDMYGYSSNYNTVPWDSVKSNIKTVIIENGVTSIGSSAFEDCRSLTSVTISDSVTSIGSSAFNGCSSLESIVIGNGVTSIGSSAFHDCSSLTSVTIPDSVTSIGYYAFYGCSSLDSVYISDIAAYLNIYFVYLNIDSEVSYSNPMRYANKLYLNGELVTDLIIPDGVTKIPAYAFYGCSSLTSVTISDSVTSIGDKAFNGCSSLTSVTIPDSVTSIGDEAFYGCRNLDSIYISDIAAYLNIDFADNTSNPMRYANKLYLNGELVTDLIIPDGVTKIPAYAFLYCSSLTSVTIPDSVTSIGEYAFERCSSLTSVTIPDSVTSIGYMAFGDCSSLTSVTIPDSVTSIGSSAFEDCSSLTSVTIPDSVTSIGRYAFDRCRSLESVTIGNGVTSIGDEAFRYCSSLDGIYISDIAAYLNIDFADYTSNPMCYANKLYLNGELVTDLIIPDGVTKIPAYAFLKCSSLTSITIPDSVTSIGEYAFERCSSLTSVTIPDSVTSIGYMAFCECNSLKTVYYTGSEEEWKEVSIYSGNTDLKNAEIIYNYVPEGR